MTVTDKTLPAAARGTSVYAFMPNGFSSPMSHRLILPSNSHVGQIASRSSSTIRSCVVVADDSRFLDALEHRCEACPFPGPWGHRHAHPPIYCGTYTLSEKCKANLRANEQGHWPRQSANCGLLISGSFPGAATDLVRMHICYAMLSLDNLHCRTDYSRRSGRGQNGREN